MCLVQTFCSSQEGKTPSAKSVDNRNPSSDRVDLEMLNKIAQRSRQMLIAAVSLQSSD